MSTACGHGGPGFGTEDLQQARIGFRLGQQALESLRRGENDGAGGRQRRTDPAEAQLQR